MVLEWQVSLSVLSVAHSVSQPSARTDGDDGLVGEAECRLRYVCVLHASSRECVTFGSGPLNGGWIGICDSYFLGLGGHLLHC